MGSSTVGKDRQKPSVTVGKSTARRQIKINTEQKFKAGTKKPTFLNVLGDERTFRFEKRDGKIVLWKIKPRSFQRCYFLLKGTKQYYEVTEKTTCTPDYETLMKNIGKLKRGKCAHF